MKNRYKNFLKVVTLFSFFTFMLTYDSYAQFGCGTGIPITNGYTQMGITTPGTGGIEDWNTNPTGTSISSSYWDDDVYLFEYTSGATAENISMTIFTRNGWNGIGIFDDCTGTTFSTELDADGSGTANVSRTVSATIAPGNTVYIAVGQWGTPNDLDFDVTNFTVTQILCPDPSALTATNVTTTSADLAWTENGTATTWDIEWGTVGFTPTGTPNIIGTTTNPHNLTGLSANTAYDFYVRADCGGNGTSSWVGPYTFTTPCVAVIAPWSESFENAGAIPACWSQGASNGENWLFANTGSGNHIGNNGTLTGTTTSGNYFAWVDDSSPHNTGTTLESPFVDVTALTNPMLSFFLISNNEGNSNVNFSVDVWDGASWNTGVYTSNTNTLNGGWEQIDVYLTSLTITGDIKLRFIVDENNGTDFYDDVAIDDVEIKEAPACPEPTALTATNITATTADLGWTENGTATTWDIEWGTAGFTPTGTPNIVGTTTNPHNLTGLTALTSYDFYVRADCAGNGTSNWSGPYNFTTTCTAPLAGNYTIGATGNYLTFTDAVNALMACGISAPVVFDVLTGSGPYSEQITITSITGASATNTITFNGNGETITFSTSTSPDNYIIRLDGADYITFNNLNVVSQATTNNFAFHLINDADFNTINNCTIDLTSTFSSTGTTNGGIVVSGSLTSATTAGASGTDNTFTNNTIIGGYYSITINGASSTVNSLNNTITNNDFQNFYTYGMYLRSISNSTISNNEMSRMTRSPLGSFYGIYFITSGENNLIEANEIHDAFTGVGGVSTSLAYPIFHSSVDATVGNANKVVNNLIYNINTNGTIYGFYNLGSDGVHYYHNTVSIDDAASTAGTTRGFYQTTTASDIEFKNNIITVTKGGTGTKHCIYFNATASTITSNNNVFYINAPAGTNNLGYFSATNQATLLDWQTASSQDASSSGADPIYANLLSNDLTPTNAAIDNMADATVGVANDFYGIARAATPDPGAIEFTPPACLAPSALTATNITATSADLGWTENGTATTWDIEWGTAGFTPTGTPTIVGTTTNPHNLTGLTAQTAYEFYVRADCGGNGTSTWAGPFAFTTECAAVVAPWIESFENAGAIPACWSQGASNGENWLFANTGSGNHIGNNGTLTGATTSGNYFAWVDDSSPHSTGTTLESPFIDVTALTNPMLSFFLISDNEGNSNVNFSVDVWDGAAWNTGVYTSNTNTLNGGWEQINVVLSSLTITGDIRLRFIVDENNGTDFYDDVAIDDVEIKEAPSCPDPSALSATNISATSADLGWTENGTATTWDIEWGTAGFTPTGVPTIVGTTTNPHNLTGLTANTAYEFYVRAMCSASDSSAWVGPYTFTTPCNTVTTFPFLEDFETTSTTRDCWTQIEELGSASWTYATGSSGGAISTAYSGTENARFVSQSGTNSPVVKLVSPILDLSGVNTPELAFFYGQEVWFSDQNELKVYYRVSVDSAWVQIAHYTSDVAVWTADTLTLPNPSATYQIAFEGINNWGRANVVDDVEVYDAITCSDPSNLTAFNIQPTSAMLDWTENGTATNWNIEWDVTGFILGTGNPQAVAAKPYLLTGLMPNTSYDYYVQADCGMGDTSNWVGPYTFATPPCVPIGLNLGADTTLCANQNITLDAGSGPYTYTWSTGGSAQTELIDTTLMGGNGTYNITVTVVDNVSGCIYTDDINITFQTCTDIDELNGANAFNIYPNPTKGIVNISMAATTANTVLTIVDVQGKVVFTKTNFNISSGVVETIDLSGNDKGIYFVNFTNEQTSIVKKVVLH